MTDMTTINEPETLTAETTPSGLGRRLGCGAVIFMWLICFLIPCAVVGVVSQGGLAITTGDLPNQQFRLWLIMERREAGLGMQTATAHYRDDGLQACLDTEIRFWLWDGEGQPTRYRELYERETVNDTWMYTAVNEGDCQF